MAYKPVGADENGKFPPRVDAAYASGGVHFIVSATAPGQTTVNGKPVVWINTSGAPAPESTAPSAVTNLTAGTATETSVPLTWTAATDNVGVAGYEYSINGTTYTSTGSTGTSYTVTGLTGSTAYTLYVRAFDAAGNRGAAASVAKTTTGAPLTYVQAVTASGPVHFLPLDDTVGTTSPRKLGSAEPASYTATAVTFGATIGTLAAATFNGTTSKIIGSAVTQALTGKAAATVEAVIKADAGANTVSRYIFGQHPDGAWGLSLTPAPRASAFGATPSPNLVDNAAYHIMIVADGTNKTVYVNGVAGQTLAGALTIATATSPVDIGAKNGVADLWKGSIAGVAAYDKALTAADALAHAQAAGLA